MNRQRLILFVLAILLVIAVIWSYSARPRPKTVSTLKYPPVQKGGVVPPPAKPAPAGASDGRILALAVPQQDQTSFKGYRRNIFKPVFVDEVKLTKQKAAALKPPALALPVPAPKSALPEPAQPVPAIAARPESAPLARFTFLGFLKKDAQRTIFLAKDKDIILVKKGDKIAGRYEASSITDQALTLVVSDTGDEIVIPLIENRPLAAAK